MKRLSARAYAKIVGKHEQTIQAMCRSGKLVARRIGRSWEIDMEASERLLSLKYGNALEREMVKRGLL